MPNDADEVYIVYCYDPSQDNWTTLPPCPVKWFGLGQINGKVVAAGGVNKSDHRATMKYSHMMSDQENGNRLLLQCQQLDMSQVY